MKLCFRSFFFLFTRFGVVRLLFMHCSLNSNRKCWLFIVNNVYMHCSRIHKLHFSVTFSLKMGFTILFTHLKIILLQYFQFSVFNFSKINSIQTDPKSEKVIGRGWKSGVRWKGGFLVYKYPINVCLFTKIPKLEF